MVKLPIVGRVMSLVREKPSSRSSAARDHRLRNGFEAAPVGIAFATPDGQWLQVNECLRAMLGYSREELSRVTVNGITHEDDGKLEAPMMRRLLHGHADFYRIKKRLLHMSGTYRSVQAHVSLVRNSAGEPDFFVYFIEDDDAAAPQEPETLRDALAALRAVSEETIKELKVMTHALRNEIERRQALEEKLRITTSQPADAHDSVEVDEREWHAFDGDVARILRPIAEDQRGGALVVARNEDQHDFFFDRGRIYSCASNDPRLFLTEHLIGSGVITEEQRAKALDIKRETQLALGRILVILGIINEEQLVRAMRRKVAEELAQLAEWRGARWAFIDGDIPELKLVPLRIDVEELLAPVPRSVIAAPASKHFHLESCVKMKRISRRMRITFANESEAVAEGLEPCGMCIGL
jgi:PAS domain S-box-containing protein